MSIKQFLVSICAGTLVYVLLSFFCGESGLWAEKQLMKQKEQLVVNIDAIQSTNDELTIRKTSLLIDHAVISAYAKKLGFIQDNEKIVKISGIPSRPSINQNIGKKYLKSEIQFIPEWICKCLGSVFFFLSFIITILTGLRKRNYKKYSFNEVCT
ncbi:MAG TPA: septum formation initiator family protein [Treponemataceae bacterium]|nr:septum formation initiator family protein [Treponemataceae bacterium]